jgi:hypothetical protein
VAMAVRLVEVEIDGSKDLRFGLEKLLGAQKKILIPVAVSSSYHWRMVPALLFT